MSKYIIITCVKNEEAVIQITLDSVVNQTKIPQEWLIIDDNSSDNTYEIVKKYSNEYNWIRCVRNNKITELEKGARIASLINTYLKTILSNDYKFFSKLDGDLSLPNNFFESLLNEFKNNEKLGIASGSLTFRGVKEKTIYKELTRGATKFYRKSCFDDIGGLALTTGWDTYDNIIAQTKGWETKVVDIWFEHLEEEGASQGIFKKYYHSGVYYGKIPYHSWYFAIKLFYKIFEKPMFISSFILTLGYIKSRFITRERPFPKDVTKYFRNKQKELLLQAINSYIK